MRLAAIVISLCAVLGASAADTVVADTVFARRPATLKLHYRISLPDTRRPAAELRWNVTDPATYDYVRFTFDRDSRDDEWDSYTVCETGAAEGGLRSRTARTRHRLYDDPFTGGFSFRISSGEGGALFSAGVTSPTVSLPIDISDGGTARVMLVAESGTGLIGSFVTAESAEAPIMSAFADTDSLAAYLSRSDDPCEGIWIYYDHVTRPERTIVGGRYVLATVADGAGGYDIVYLGGARDSAEDWPQLRLKGRLAPATFPGIFDLEWIQPSGVALPAEYGCGAAFSDDLLTLQFPYWQATVRFRRQK